MKKMLKIGDKLGYLNPYTGRYFFVEIVAIKYNTITMLQVQKVGNKLIDNIYNEQLPNVIRWLKEESLDFKDGRKLVKHRSIKANYLTKSAIRYENHLNLNQSINN